jgi:hypothetical protein
MERYPGLGGEDAVQENAATVHRSFVAAVMVSPANPIVNDITDSSHVSTPMLTFGRVAAYEKGNNSSHPISSQRPASPTHPHAL